MHHPIKKGSQEHLAERSRYLNTLMQEFLELKKYNEQSSKKKISNKRKIEVEEQLLANLTNFAYDPYNHDLFIQLGLHHRVFLYVIQEKGTNKTESGNSYKDKTVEFALAGLSNCAPHHGIRKDLISRETIPLVLSLHSETLGTDTGSSVESVDILTSSLSLMFFLLGHDTLNEFQKSSTALLKFLHYTQHHSDKRVSNLAFVLLENLQKFRFSGL